VAQFAAGVVDTGGEFDNCGKFATGIVDTVGEFDNGINNASEIGCRW
jgi:hypothetical protein